MHNLASGPIAPILGQRIPLRGPARILYRSYAKTRCNPGDSARQLTTKAGDSFAVDLSSFLEWQLWAFGSYEEHFADLFRYLVRPADRCIDVGANIGIHTVRLAKLVGVRGKVIALEPDSELSRRAANNIHLNNLANVCLIQAAASGTGGDTVSLYRPEARDPNKGRASLVPHRYLTGATAQVPTVAIDDINEDPVALIKIDVEGYEATVVSGASRTIDAYSPALILEYDPELIPTQPGSLVELLRERGYDLFRICHYRHGLTGRGKLELEYLRNAPESSANILAISASRVSQVRPLVRS